MIRFFCASPGLYKATDLLKYVSVTVEGAEVELMVIKKRKYRGGASIYSVMVWGGGAFMVAQWLRIPLPIKETQI